MRLVAVVLLLASVASSQVSYHTLDGAVGTSFGSALAAVGDLDGDGVEELAVGAPSTPGGGAVQVFAGSSGALLFSVHPAASTLLFGSAVAAAGDVDGDGVPDLLVGAYADSTGAPSAGRAFVHSGAGGALLRVLHDDHAQTNLGLSVASAGDVDLDGVPDAAAGAPGHAFGAPQSGRVVVFSGFDAAVLHTVPGLLNGDDFGWSLALLDDLDGDGVRELAIGAIGELPGPGAGRVALADGATGNVLRVLLPPVPAPDFGLALQAFDDLDGDGLGELAVGSPLHSAGFFHSGAVFLYSPASGALHSLLRGATPGESLGGALARLPDVTADGFSELLIGAPAAPGVQFAPGRVVVVDAVHAWRLAQIDGPFPGAQLGLAVASAGDTNGDGVPEIAVAALAPVLGGYVDVLGKP
jgi:hypothetical protein